MNRKLTILCCGELMKYRCKKKQCGFYDEYYVCKKCRKKKYDDSKDDKEYSEADYETWMKL